MAAADGPVADEQQIIERAKHGDDEAFRVLMEHYLKPAYDLAHRFCGDHHGADDIVQEAFVKVHTSLRTFRGESAFGTWLHRIVVNMALTHKRRALTRREEMHDESYLHNAGNHDPLHMKERQAHIERALHELPTLQRAVVILRHLNGLSTRQVSEILNCSEGTVKTHLFRGLKNLRGRLAHLEEGLA